MSAVERELGGQGRVLIRASGTEPVVRVMVEARDAEAAQRSAQRTRGQPWAEGVAAQRVADAAGFATRAASRGRPDAPGLSRKCHPGAP